MNISAGIVIAAYTLVTASFVSSIFLDNRTPTWYFLQYFIYILSFIIVDAASIVQTLYLNY